MTENDYFALIDNCSLGKKLPDALYMHKTGLKQEPELNKLSQKAARIAGLESERYNVIKFGLKKQKISLLDYPAFFDEAFPPLSTSWTVDLLNETARCTRYNPAGNGPILHRKELLLTLDHPRHAEFSELTQSAEQAGLLDDKRHIGFRHYWNEVLQACGYGVEGNALVKIRPDEGARERIRIRRHKTAIHRNKLSSPVKLLWLHDFLNGTYSIFDYGCGRGDDVQALTEHNLDAAGWDPYFAPELTKKRSDIVNLGFVLNVIEDPTERKEALLGAASLADKLLVVSVLLGGRSAMEKHRLFQDGVITSRDTFQKYYSQEELSKYIEEVLEVSPIAVSPGCFYIFFDGAEEQNFLARRQRSYQPNASLPASRLARVKPGTPKKPRKARPRKPNKYELFADLAEKFWNSCLQLGRVPGSDEFEDHDELIANLGKPKTVFNYLVRKFGTEELKKSQEARKADLLVFLALNMFEQRKSFKSLPKNLQKDIRMFLGSYSKALEQAKILLFSVGAREIILKHVLNIKTEGIGFLEGNHSLILHTSLLKNLPPVLRVLLGCAARMYGDIEHADLVKIHLQSAKVSVMNYDDFEGKSLPMLLERVKIDLGRQKVHFFDYGKIDNSQLLFYKSRYLPGNHPMLEQQARFDDDLSKLEFLDLSGYGPSQKQFFELMESAGFSTSGFSITQQR